MIKKVKLKVLSIFLCFMMCFSLVSCGDDNDPDSDNNQNTPVSVSAETVLSTALSNLYSEANFAINLSSSTNDVVTSTAKIQINLTSDYLLFNYMDEGESDSDLSQAYFVQKVSEELYEVRLYDFVNGFYIEYSSELTLRKVYDLLSSNYAIINWFEYYENFLKSDNSTISATQTGSNVVVTITTDVDDVKSVVINISENYLTSVEISKSNNIVNTLTFDYTDKTEYDLSKFEQREETTEDTIESILANAYLNYTESQITSINVYSYNFSDSTSSTENYLVRVSETTQEVLNQTEDYLLIFETQSVGINYYDYDLIQNTYSSSTVSEEDEYSILFYNFSILNWYEFTKHCSTDIASASTFSSNITSSQYDYSINLQLVNKNDEILYSISIFINDGYIVQTQIYEYDLNDTSGGIQYTLTYTYGVETDELDIDLNDFTLSE